MTEPLSGLFAVLIFITVALTAFSIGVLTTWPALRATVLRRAFPFIILVNIVLVPLVAWGLVRSLDLDTDVATGILLCSVCAAGPLGLKASQIARTDLTWALSLTVILLAVNVVALPLWSALLIDQTLVIRPTDLVGVLVLSILVPVVGGIWWGRRSRDAQHVSKRATLVSNVTMILAIAVGIVGNMGALVEALNSPVLPVTMLVIVIAGGTAWLVPDGVGRRRSSSLASLNRATSVALLVVGRVFVDRPDVFTTAVVFGLVQTVLALGLASYWRWAGSAHSAAIPASPH